MKRARVYLDHNASAPLLPAARDAIVDALNQVGNGSSIHTDGRAVRKIVEDARRKLANLVGAETREVVFTGSGSEALTQAIVGGAKAFGVSRIVISAVEHPAVRSAAAATELPVSRLGVDENGLLQMEGVEALLAELDATGATALFAIQWVNNETGVVQSLNDIETLIGPTRHVMIVDAVQALGKRSLDFASRAADMMAVSAHKIGGPAGVGALLMKAHCDGAKIVPGGGQERGRRGGTEPTSLIAGFGAAAQEIPNAYDAEEITELTRFVERRVAELVDGSSVFGIDVDRAGNVINFSVPGIESAVSLMALDLEGVSVSSGSACSSGKVGKSHVLSAMGVSDAVAATALRVSLGWSTTKEECEAFLAALEKVIERSRTGRGAAA